MIKKKFFDILPFLIVANVFIILAKYISFSSITLMRLIPIFFLINTILIIVFFVLDFKNITKLFNKINKRTWIFLLLIFILAFSLRAFVAPDTHRVYYDEDIYLNIAQNIVNDGRAILCNRGTPDFCEEGVLNKQPQGLSFFLASFFIFLGHSEKLASILMVLASSLTTVILFLAVYLLIRKEEPALYSSLILALIPIHILWAPTITGETLLVFFGTLSLTAILAFKSNRSTKTLFLASSLLAFAAQIRPEAPLLIPVMFLFFLREKLNTRLLIAFTLLLVLFSPYVLQFKNVSGDTWGASSGNKLGLNYIKPNSSVNSRFFIENTRFPMLFTPFVFLGILFFLFKKKYTYISIFIAWFLAFFSIYALFYAGSFNYGADVRFSSSLYIPIAILAGFGVYFLRSLIPIKKKLITSSIMVMAILLIFYPFLPFVSAIGEEAWDARLAHDFAIEEARTQGDNCYVLTHVPTQFLINDIPALQTWYGSNTLVMNELFAKTDCILYDEGYWCVNVAQYKEGVCKHLKDNYNLISLNSATEREKTFSLYKVERK